MNMQGMNMKDTAKNVLRATGNVLAQALSLDGKATELFSSGDLTFADDADVIMYNVRRVAGSPGRRVAGSPNLRPRDGHERVRVAAPAGPSILSA